jgi:hypothetical protein
VTTFLLPFTKIIKEANKMAEYNKELVQRLAHGDEKAFEEVSKLPASTRIGLGVSVEEYRRNNNVVPMNNGFSLYERPKSEYISDEEVGDAMKKRMDQQRENEERQQKIREAFIEEQVKAQIERSRAGLRKR